MKELEPMDLALRKLVDQSNKAEPRPTEAQRAESWVRLASAVASAPIAASSSRGGLRGWKQAVLHRGVIAAVAFGVGVGTGAVLQSAWHERPETAKPVHAPSAEPAALPTPAASPDSGREILVDAGAPTETSVNKPTKESAPSLADPTAERLLIERARSALARADASAAWSALSQHERRYRNGVLAEEREALAVQTLVSLDRREEARRRAQRFHAEFPHSLFGPVVDRVLTP